MWDSMWGGVGEEKGRQEMEEWRETGCEKDCWGSRLRSSFLHRQCDCLVSSYV